MGYVFVEVVFVLGVKVNLIFGLVIIKVFVNVLFIIIESVE